MPKDDLAAFQRELNALVAPLSAYVSGAGAASKGIDRNWGYLLAIAGLILSAMATLVVAFHH